MGAFDHEPTFEQMLLEAQAAADSIAAGSPPFGPSSLDAFGCGHGELFVDDRPRYPQSCGPTPAPGESTALPSSYAPEVNPPAASPDPARLHDTNPTQAGDLDPTLLLYYAESPVPPDADPDTAEVAPPPCAVEPFSVAGLRRLAVDNPDWSRRLHAHLPPEVLRDIEVGRADRDASLAQVLLAHTPQLLPPTGDPYGVETVRRARQVLAVVKEHDGDMLANRASVRLPVIWSNAAALERADGRRPLSPENVSRAMSLVRSALDGWLSARGEAPLAPADPVVPAPPRPPQRTVPLRRVWQLLRDASPAEMIKIGLAVGAGLREPEIEALCTGDLAVREVPPKVAVRLGLLPGVRLMFVRVRLSDPAQTRWTPLPAWVAELILVARPGLGTEREEAGPLVPAGLAPSLTATLRRLQKDVRGESGQRITPSDLRRTWQAIARRSGGCGTREVVRGTWCQHEDRGWPKRWHRAQAHLWRLAASWGQFAGGVAAGFVDHVDLVPRRARPGCRAAGLEIAPKRSKRRKSSPLPSRVRELPPPPDKAK